MATPDDTSVELTAVPDDSVSRYVANRAIARLRVIDDVRALHCLERRENTHELDEVGYMLREIRQWLRDGRAPE
jgi:hypothetical protein